MLLASTHRPSTKWERVTLRCDPPLAAMIESALGVSPGLLALSPTDAVTSLALQGGRQRSGLRGGALRVLALDASGQLRGLDASAAEAETRAAEAETRAARAEAELARVCEKVRSHSRALDRTARASEARRNGIRVAEGRAG